MNERRTTFSRQTRETEIELSLNLDGSRQISIATGLVFFDHMLSALAFHAGWDLSLHCDGDLQVDDHHTIEDCGLALGESLRTIVADRGGIVRFGSQYAPLDEALARTVVDISGRGGSVVDLDLHREKIGDVACENLKHFFQSFALSAQLTLHVDVLRGDNDHHRAEAAFKATALALKQALKRTVDSQIPSTKGVL